MRTRWWLLWLSLIPLACQAQQVFRDGFEAFGIACVQGPPQGDVLGSAASSGFTQLACVQLRNDLAFDRRGELAFGGVPVPRAVDLRDGDLARLLLVGPGGTRLPAQFDILSRWDDVADGTGPARWLQISVPADVTAGTDAVFALLRYSTTPAAVADPLALTVDTVNARWQIDTGVARFEIDPANPTLFHRIALRETTGGALTDVLVYTPGAAGYGPRLDVGNGSGGRLFLAGNEVAGSLQLVNAELREVGPTQVVIVADGEFSSGDGNSRCAVADPTHASFQFSVELRFSRGSRHVDLYHVLRNACSDATGSNWTDQAAQILSYQWGWPLLADSAASAVAYYGGSSNAAVSTAGPAAEPLRVEQQRGGGNPWMRRAQVTLPDAAQTLDSAVSFSRPLAALRNDRVLAALHAPWMRLREPQAMVVDGSRLAMQFISEPVVLGEGKGVWFQNRLSLAPAATEIDPVARLQQWRTAAYAALERGLLPRIAEWNNAGDHWPPLSGTGSSAALGPYLRFMSSHHERTVSEAPCVDPATQDGGQWDCSKAYGSQLWPDIPFNEQFGFEFNATPADKLPYNNYWNPTNAELYEFLRAGEPRWVWEFSLPQSWLQAQTATLNLGDRAGTTRNGFVVNSTGNGDGHWHRGLGGSDDYNYNRGAHLAFALRPNHLMRDRFRTQGATVIGRYSIARAAQGTRDEFVNAVLLDRGPMQHFEALANCAEFVPGSSGTACQNKLLELLDELAQDNLATGVICAQDDPADGCFFGQQFMINSMFYTFLQRMLLNYGDILHETDNQSVLRRALVELPKRYRDFGMPVANDVIDVSGTWAEGFNCTRSGDGRSVTACTPVNIEGGNFFFINRPQTISLLLMSDWLAPDPALCAQARRALQDMFPDPDGLGPLAEDANGGWWKGSSQIMQSMVFAVGLEQRCSSGN